MKQEYINLNNPRTPFQFPKTIYLGRFSIGEGNPTKFIAEVGANFDHDLKTAKKYCEIAKEIGADTVKFQSFLAPKIVSGPGFASMKLKGIHGSWGRPVEEIFKDAEFPREWHKEIANHCKKIGIDFASSPWDFEAVDLLESVGVKWFKIGSGDITWHDMLRYIARKKKPMMLATGASTLAEVDEAVSVIAETGNMDLLLMQCITNYPSKIESANINVLKTYQNTYDIITGYSDHSPGDTVVLGAVALGAKIIEKHFTLNRKNAGPDHPHSMEPQEFKAMIKKVRDLEAALGSAQKFVVPEEFETVIVQRRSLYAARPIKAGAVITEKDIEELRPALGIYPKYRSAVVGKKAGAAIKKGMPIRWEDMG